MEIYFKEKCFYSEQINTTVYDIMNNCLIFSLKELMLKFSHSYLISLFSIVSLFSIMFFPILSLDLSTIWIYSDLTLKFCWKFMSNQSLLIMWALKILRSWIACLYFITCGLDLLWKLCLCSYDILRSFMLHKSLKPFADAASHILGWLCYTELLTSKIFVKNNFDPHKPFFHI